MTQIPVSEELATSIRSLASSSGCSTEEFLQLVVSRFESDDEFAERVLTPELQTRMLDDLARVDRGEFVTSEEVDRTFEALFRELESR
jgi:hypothetical protein